MTEEEMAEAQNWVITNAKDYNLGDETAFDFAERAFLAGYNEAQNTITQCNRSALKRAYQYGAEFGYNKAKEEMIQNGLVLQSDMDKTIEQNIALKKELNKANEWHDLRKNPNDLPNECEIVVCYCLGYCGVSYPITAQLYIDYEDSSVHRWWTIAGEGHSEQLNNVIAWKEIVLPKDIKEDDE